MQLIAVDIGNSSTKIAVQDLDEQRQLRWYEQFVYRNDDAIEPVLTDIPAFWSVCSVNQSRFQVLTDWINTNRSQDHVHFIQESDIPIQSDIVSRMRTGRDRLLGAWHAHKLNSGPVIVIDAGTAVTIDVVDQGGVFQGGVIFPGAMTNLRQLHLGAPALPDLSDRENMKSLEILFEKTIGKDTRTAILAGVFQAQMGAIRGIVDSIVEKYRLEFEIYATGGGIVDLERHLPQEWILIPDLVLRGAKSIGEKLMREKALP